MQVQKFMSSRAGRVVQVAAGVPLVWFGTSEPTLIGLVTMMIGLVPVVTGVTNLWLFHRPSS